MKVAIVGAGIGGLSLAWALRRRGVAVTLFDQGAIPNPVSSSHDEHRITRHTYAGLPGYAALMPAAFRTYETLWGDLGRTHYLPTGLVYLSRVEGDNYGPVSAELDGLGIGHRRLDADELAARFPFISPEGLNSAFEAGGAGVLFASRIVTDLVRWLGENGADLRPHSRVTAVDFDRGVVRTTDGEHSADVVVVAAGAWLSDLVPGLAGRLVASRQLVLYLQPPAHHAEAWGRAPVIVDVAGDHGAYILPPRDGTRLKIGDHVFSRRGHGSDDRLATDEDVAPVLGALRGIVRDVDRYTILERKVCYYTVAEDERFVVEPQGQAGWVLSACSGHGFKLGPLVGERLAAALVGEVPAASISRELAGL